MVMEKPSEGCVGDYACVTAWYRCTELRIVRAGVWHPPRGREHALREEGENAGSRTEVRKEEAVLPEAGEIPATRGHIHAMCVTRYGSLMTIRNRGPRMSSVSTI